MSPPHPFTSCRLAENDEEPELEATEIRLDICEEYGFEFDYDWTICEPHQDSDSN
jgi:hypothetical protein